jgi:6-phosphofructokinase 1
MASKGKVGQVGKVAIIVGGGPAPGINSVIAAATIRSAIEGVDVVGVHDGFEGLMEGDADCLRPLTITDVSRIHFRGGSILGTSRANPTRDPAHLSRTFETLRDAGVDCVITIGGDDTAFSAMKLAETAGDALRVVHVPKTIDNDLDLPADVDTFGYATARHVGAEIVKNLMTDAFTTSRWYFVVTMGRKAGHLALGIGKAAGATLTLIPEEFAARPVRLASVVDTLVGAVIKRVADGQRHGVAVIAEGVALALDESDLGGIAGVERDDHGHVRIAEIDLGDMLKKAVRERLAEFDVQATIVSKDIGYELRSVDPTPADAEYTRDLGYCAAKYVLEGGNSAMVSIESGRFVPVPFDTMIDPESGRTKVRLVDTESTRYGIARRYMIRIRRDDLRDDDAMERIAAVTNKSAAEVASELGHVADEEPAPLEFHLALGS